MNDQDEVIEVEATVVEPGAASEAVGEPIEVVDFGPPEPLEGDEEGPEPESHLELDALVVERLQERAAACGKDPNELLRELLAQPMVSMTVELPERTFQALALRATQRRKTVGDVAGEIVGAALRSRRTTRAAGTSVGASTQTSRATTINTVSLFATLAVITATAIVFLVKG